MAVAITDLYKSALEVVRTGILPKLYMPEKEGAAWASQIVLRGAESFKITKTPNSTDFRIPLKMQPIGQFGAANYAGGSIGVGGSANIQQFAQTYFPMKMVYQLNEDAIRGTADKDLARFNAWKESMKEGIPLFQRYLDVSWHEIGGATGNIANAGTGTTATSYNLDATNGSDLLIEGQGVEIFDTLGTTWKTSAVSPDNLPTVASLDKTNKTVTLGNLGSITLADGDKLYFRGVGSTPTWLNALQYFNDSSTSGSLLGLSRSTYPQIIANLVGNTSTQFSLESVLLLKHEIKQRRNEVPKLVGLMPQSQEAVINLSIVTMSEYMRREVNEKAIDPLPEMANMQPFAGIPHMTDLHQPRNRVDYVDRESWGYVYLSGAEPDFYKDPGSDSIFFKPYVVSGSTAAPAFATMWALTCEKNFFCIDPGRQGYILASIPTGY